DYSAGMLTYTNGGCPGGYTGCVTSPVTLNRPCTSVASGTVSGTTANFSSNCTVPSYPGPYVGDGLDGGTPSSAQQTWTYPMDQVDTSVNTSCLANFAIYGNVTCSGALCGFVPAGVTGPRDNTGDQYLGAFTFSSTTYESATLSLPEQLLPDALSDVANGFS